MATTTATTLRKSGKGRRLEASVEPPLVIDGPYAETKEQLLGFYLIDCADAGGGARDRPGAGPGQPGRRLRAAPGVAVPAGSRAAK